MTVDGLTRALVAGGVGQLPGGNLLYGLIHWVGAVPVLLTSVCLSQLMLLPALAGWTKESSSGSCRARDGCKREHANAPGTCSHPQSHIGLHELPSTGSWKRSVLCLGCHCAAEMSTGQGLAVRTSSLSLSA